MDERSLGKAVENLLVARNPRGMKTLQAALKPGYYLRAAKLLHRATGTVLIGTGFPIADSFETDGPLGAIVLHDTLKAQGAKPVIVCDKPLSDALQGSYRVHEIDLGLEAPDSHCDADQKPPVIRPHEESGRDCPTGINGTLAAMGLSPARQAAMDCRAADALAALKALSPQLIVSIEMPGLTDQGGYFNMKGEDITSRCPCFDPFVELADCPTIAIGDGGNEIGMGNVPDAVRSLNIVPAVTGCDELLVADVSNWGAYGLLALMGFWRGEDLLGGISPTALLRYLNDRGGLDGVTGQRTPTEDGFDAAAGEAVIESLQRLTIQSH